MEFLPMPLEATEPFSDASFIFEPKFNGIRLIATRFSGKVRLWTRHGTDITSRYPELWDIPVEGDVVLDCELIVLDETGQDDFELCMIRFHSTQREPVAHAVVFDVLYCNGQDVRRLTLMDRKSLLERFLENNAAYSKIIYVDGAGEELFAAIQKRGMEGMVGKRKKATYDLYGRRTSAFLKVIDWKVRDDVFITGWMKEKFGWLISIRGEAGYRPAGTVVFGFDPAQKKAFYTIAHQIVLKEDSKRVCISPVFRIRVKYRNMTKRGMLHTPVFLDFVQDPAPASDRHVKVPIPPYGR